MAVERSVFPVGGRVESVVRVSYQVGGTSLIDTVRTVDQFFTPDGKAIALQDDLWESLIENVIKLGCSSSFSDRDFRLHVIAVAILRRRAIYGDDGLYRDLERSMGLSRVSIAVHKSAALGKSEDMYPVSFVAEPEVP